MSDLCKCGHAEDHHFTPRLGGRCFRHECECVAFETPAADRDDLAAKPFSRVSEHDAYDLNQLAEVISQAIEAASPGRFVLLDERYGAAVAVLESDWLRDVKAEAAQDERDRMLKPWPGEWVIHDGCDDAPEVRHYHVGDRCPYRADRVDAEDTDNTTDRT